MEELLDKPRTTPKVSKGRTFLRISIVTVIGAYAAAILIALDNIFTITISGPIMGGIGLIVIVAGLILKEKTATISGSFTLASVLGIFLLIYLLGIHPHEAQLIVPFLGGLCVLVLIGLGIWLFSSTRDKG